MDSTDYYSKIGKPEMKIYLNNNIYFPGETIKGTLFLKSGNCLEKGIITYEIYGQEKINEINKYNIECNNSTKIYYISLEYPGLINYSLSNGIEIPFEIILPSYILPSFEYSINKNNYGYIKFYLQIEISELNLIKQKFIIIRRPNLKLNSSLSFKSERNEKMLGIFKKGCPILNASFDKNYYYFNEEIIVKLYYNNNNSKFDIKNINVKLIRNIIFKLKENNENKNIIFLNNKTKEKIEDIIFYDELFYKNINMNDKIDMNNKNKNINFDVKIKLKEPENIFNKNNVDYLNLGLNDKSNLILFLPSFESSLFKCEYIIKIEGIYDTILPIQNLVINMPISAYHKKIGNEDDDYTLLNSKENINENNNNEFIDNDRLNTDEEKKNKKEVRTYRNDEEKEWNNITNGQIIPEKITDDNEKNN